MFSVPFKTVHPVSLRLCLFTLIGVRPLITAPSQGTAPAGAKRGHRSLSYPRQLRITFQLMARTPVNCSLINMSLSRIYLREAS